MRFLLLGVPVIAFLLLGLTFSNAVVRGLNVIVVDMDNSATSRLFMQTAAAAPGITIAERADDLGAAASAIRAGRAIASIYLPPDFGKDVLAGRAPRPVAFINTQFFTPGNNAAKSIRDAMAAAGAAVAPAQATLGNHEPAPGLVPEEYVLANPALNYAQFLLRAVLPTVLHVVVAISAGYAVGSEFRRRNLHAWWAISGKRLATALLGKLLPYYVAHMLMFVLMVGVPRRVAWRRLPRQCPVDGRIGDTADHRLSDDRLPDAVAVTQPRTWAEPDRHHRLTGFRFCRRRFSRHRDGSFPQAWGAMLPLRWYIQILFDQATRGAAVAYTAEPFAIFCGLTTVLALLVSLRFHSMVRHGLTVPEDDELAPESSKAGVGGAFAAEWRRVICDRGVLGLFVLAPVLYAVFYPQPYLGQIVRNIPIAVVDQDHSELARG